MMRTIPAIQNTYRELMQLGTYTLTAAGVTDTPYLDALLLLCHVSGKTREQMLASLPDHTNNETMGTYNKLLMVRKTGKPIAYILKNKEFYGHDFYVDERVLIPRPDTELLVETALSLFKRGLPDNSILDLCTGSGCVGISIQAEIPGADISLSDISSDALNVSNINSQRILGKELSLYHSNLLESIPGPFSLIASNPPYLTLNECMQEDLVARGEPENALAAGIDGLDIIRRLARQGFAKLHKKGYLIIECGFDQAQRVSEIMSFAGFVHTEILKDLAGRDRVVMGSKG
ncbi:MAG: peptide chain release factor N(5)-glutamine methyltransferase [Bacteroidetes bacterium]|nr:peptide chain release factor N(5)-glutamine methyltransferase [Bacteroidota bacterium]